MKEFFAENLIHLKSIPPPCKKRDTSLHPKGGAKTILQNIDNLKPNPDTKVQTIFYVETV